MNMDDTIRKAIFHLTTAGEVKWNDFSFVGIDDSYTTWYYAEKEQYILWDAVTDGYYFIKARSPIEALYKYKCRWDEAMKAGLCQEEEEW